MSPYFESSLMIFISEPVSFAVVKGAEKTKIHTIISRNLVLAINRRLRNEEDKCKLSIYYLESETSNIIKEMKLKTESRYDMEQWITKLNKNINPKRFKFDINSKNYVKSNDIFHFKNETNFYVALCNLEYILLKKKMKTFFEIYKNNEAESMDIIINDNTDYTNLMDG